MGSTPKLGPIVRVARPEDAAEIASVHLNSWREAYRELLPQSYLDGLPLTFRRRKQSWEATLRGDGEFRDLFVVECPRNGVVGFSVVGQGRDEDRREWGEVGAIYLLETYKSRGHGRDLLTNSFRALKSRGYKRCYCWVLEGNPTIRFYEKSGARIGTATQDIEIQGKAYTELVMEWNPIP